MGQSSNGRPVRQLVERGDGPLPSPAAHITLQQLQTLRAVVEGGGFEAGAKTLSRSHPSIIAAIKNLEAQLGLSLFDREGYRATLTDDGRQMYRGVLRVLAEVDRLLKEAEHLRRQEGAQVDIIIGDITPLDRVLDVLRRFSISAPHVQVNLYSENLSVPVERLLEGKADLIVHHIDKTDTRFECVDIGAVEMVPVVAPGFLDGDVGTDLTYEHLRRYTQCIIRDPGRSGRSKNYFVLQGARHMTVTDQSSKKELIKQGLGWGHMPTYMISEDLASGALLSVAGKHIKKRYVELVVARLASVPRLPSAERLWMCFQPGTQQPFRK